MSKREPSPSDRIPDIVKRAAKKPKAAFELFDDIELWDAADEAAQDLAIEAALSEELAEDGYELVDAETYECAGIRHRIAAFRMKSTGAVLHLIPGGRFIMGLHEEDVYLSEHGWFEREVHIRRPFLIGRTAVSQEQWDRFEIDDERSYDGPDLPIDNIYWAQAQEWLAQAGAGLRLPSEAEWEYACRAGSTTYYCFGNTITSEQANFDGELQVGEDGEFRDCPVPVDWFWPNAFGLFQMHGNVAEWCQDGRNSPHLDEGPGPVDERPINAHNEGYVFRGGNWMSGPAAINSTTRFWDLEASPGLGFRIARSLDPLRD